MEAINDSSKLVAQSIDILKGYKKAADEHEIWEITPIEESIALLEQALDKLTNKM